MLKLVNLSYSLNEFLIKSTFKLIIMFIILLFILLLTIGVQYKLGLITKNEIYKILELNKFIYFKNNYKTILILKIYDLSYKLSSKYI